MQRQSLLRDPANLTECFKDPSCVLKNGFKVLVLAVFCLGIFPFVVSSDHGVIVLKASETFSGAGWNKLCCTSFSQLQLTCMGIKNKSTPFCPL